MKNLDESNENSCQVEDGVSNIRRVAEKRVPNTEGKAYNISMGFLSIIVVIMTLIEITMDLSIVYIQTLNILNLIIWIIFVSDYIYRFKISENKRIFILNNKIDLISIIPLNELFKVLRIFRIGKIFRMVKVFRMMIFFTRTKTSFEKFIKTNNFHYVLYVTITIIFLGATAISIVEKMNLSDSLWWSFVTTTTVGYGDISPETSIGRIIAAILMLVGIGFIGMLTGTIATFFIKNIEEKNSYKERVIMDIKEQLDNIDELSNEDIEDINKVLKALIKKD